ncbi:12443_t:CDS:2, partial [Entrophospora sp. SA101]
VSESDKDDNSSYDVLVAEEEEEKYGDLEYLEKRHMLLKRIKEEKPMTSFSLKLDNKDVFDVTIKT